jgi:hypothetical protein
MQKTKKDITVANDEPVLEFSRIIDLRNLPAKGVQDSFEALPEECDALNKRFGLLGITSLKVDVTLSPGHRIIEGEKVHAFDFKATVVAKATDVVSDKANTVTHAFEYVCLFDSDLPNDFDRLQAIEEAMEENIEVISGTKLDVGEIAAQEIALEIDLRPHDTSDHMVSQGDGWQFIAQTDDENN